MPDTHLNELSPDQIRTLCRLAPEFMVVHRPHAMALHQPDWMCTLYHDWMSHHYPKVLFDCNPKLCCFQYPQVAFAIDPKAVCEHYIYWVLKHKAEWLIENQPQVLNHYDRQTYDYATTTVRVGRVRSLFDRLKCALGFARSKPVLSSVIVPNEVMVRLEIEHMKRPSLAAQPECHARYSEI